MSDKPNDDLRECPFCGGKAEYQWLEAGTVSPCQRDQIDIYCTNEKCNVMIQVAGKEPDEAVKAWNTRHDSSQWVSVMKDNDIAKFVNDLTRTAQVFGSTQQIREHIRIDVLNHLPKSPEES